MKKKIKVLPFAAALAMSITPVTYGYADKMPCLSINGGYTAENEVIPVTAAFDEEVSAAVYSITVDYDPELLEFIDAESCIEDGTFCYNISGEDSVTFVWSNDKDVTVRNNVFKAEFKARGGTVGQTAPVNIGNAVIGGEKMSEIPFDTKNGDVIISERYTKGDANCDGRTDLADVVAINKYCRDMDFDLSEEGKLNGDVDNNGFLDEYDCYAVFRYVSLNSKEADHDEN